MTVASWDHSDLHPRGRDHYNQPTFHGYPEEGDEVRIVYRSKRTGDLTERVGTVEEVRDETFGGGTTHPSYLELLVDDGRDRDLRVWGGGGYSAENADAEGYAPAQVFTRGIVDDGHGGRTWRVNGLGLLVALYAPEGVTVEVTIKNVPEERLESIDARLEKAVYERFRRDKTAQDLLEVDVERTGRLDHTGTKDRRRRA